MRLFLFSVAVGLLIAGAVAGAGELLRLRQVVATGQQALSSASASVSGGAIERVASGTLDLDRSCADLSTAADAFGEAATGVARLGPLVRLVERVPSARAEANLALVALANEVSAAGDSLCQGMRPLSDLLRGPAASARLETPELLQALVAARPNLETARARLARADAALGRVPTADLEPATREAVVNLGTKLPTLRTMVDALLVVPDLLGAEAPRTYLLVAQNRDELRPTGGYVGTAGVVRVAGGRLDYGEFGTSAAFDLPPDRLVAPPAPLAKYFRSTYWQLRDANWWPDFPSSAEQMAYFYNQVRSEPIDGVIAFDQRTLELLLEHSGPIEVPEFGETISADNLQDRLSYYVHDPRVWDQEWQRKAFVGAAAAAVLRALSTAPPERLVAYAGAVGQALEAKHLLVYLGAPDAAQLTAELNWDGHLYRGPGDYVFPVSMNLGQNKVDRYVERSAHYRVDLTASPPRARLDLTIANRFDPAAQSPWLTSSYRDYLRVYVPWESTPLAMTGFAGEVETRVECGRTTFAGLVEVPPGERATLSVEYLLNPAVLESGGYTLAVQKQAGLDAFPLTVEVLARESGPYVAAGELAADRYYRLSPEGLSAGALPLPRAAEVACATPKPAPQVLAPPVRIALPSLGVDAPIANMRVLPGGEMEVPTNGVQVGWYEESARPGYAGNFVAAAHVDWGGRAAVFWRLHELRPGDRIVVTDEEGRRHTYAVQWNYPVRPDDWPIQDIVGPSHDKLLTLITCTGNFNQLTRDYSHRQILRAQLVEDGA